jgi:hypothetical protein
MVTQFEISAASAAFAFQRMTLWESLFMPAKIRSGFARRSQWRFRFLRWRRDGDREAARIGEAERKASNEKLKSLC